MLFIKIINLMSIIFVDESVEKNKRYIFTKKNISCKMIQYVFAIMENYK